jgi:hypothetical protein
MGRAASPDKLPSFASLARSFAGEGWGEGAAAQMRDLRKSWDPFDSTRPSLQECTFRAVALAVH